MTTNRSIQPFEPASGDASPHPYLHPRTLRVDASLRRQRLLQILAIATVLLAATVLALGYALFDARDDHTVIPYLVHVEDDGAVAGVQPVTTPAEPTRPMVHHALRLFILNARTVTTDRVAQRQLILRAYAYASNRAVGVLNDFYRTTPPFSRASRTTVTPRITSFLRLSDRDIYQVEWTEEVRNLNGAVVDEEAWRALLTITVEPPDSIDEALDNPLGILVEDLDWTPLSDSDHRSQP